MEAITVQVRQNIEPYPTNDFVRRELIRQGSHGTLSGRINRGRSHITGRQQALSRSVSPIGNRVLTYPTTYIIILLKDLVLCRKVRRSSNNYLRYLCRRMVVEVTFLENTPAHHMAKISEAFAHIPHNGVPHTWRILMPAGDRLVNLQGEPTGHALRHLGGTSSGQRHIFIAREQTEDTVEWTWADIYRFPKASGMKTLNLY